MEDGQATYVPVSRRCVVACFGAMAASAAVAGCATYGSPNGASQAAAPSPDGKNGGDAASGGGNALAQTSEVPVGGGAIFADKQVVLTQPAQGEFRAFTTICTHAGCTVAEVAGATINCPCHGSKFAIADGSVVAGPAPQPLPQRDITVEDGAIHLA